MNKSEENKGEKYCRLTIIKEVEKARGRRRFLCECECGSKTIVALTSLRNGNTKSCGCLKSEKTRERNLRTKTTHGKTGSREYHSWVSMIQRCNNKKDPAYKRYGGRGITVCKSWIKFENFYKDMGNRPENKSLDRIENNRGYYKENCSWNDKYVQNNNKRNNIYYELKGKKMTLTQWAVLKGINSSTLWSRVRRYNWPFEKALNTPIK